MDLRAIAFRACPLTLFLCACAEPSRRFEFAVLGDAPYVPEDEPRVAALIEQMNDRELAFVVHVGDIQADPGMPDPGGVPTCTDESLAARKRLFSASRHPFVLTPGDNDWTDAHRVRARPVDPLERLARLRAVFFATPEALGGAGLALETQAAEPARAAFVENLRWTRAGVVFATLHVVGSNDNLGRNAEMDAEHAQRSAAALEWLGAAFARARESDAPALVLLMQANPLFERDWGEQSVSRYLLGLPVPIPASPAPTGFDRLRAALAREVLAFGRPVLLVHGDTHTFRVDKPLHGADGTALAHFTRVETFGYPDLGWLRIEVDPDDPDVFAVRAVPSGT